MYIFLRTVLLNKHEFEFYISPSGYESFKKGWQVFIACQL